MTIKEFETTTLEVASRHYWPWELDQADPQVASYQQFLRQSVASSGVLIAPLVYENDDGVVLLIDGRRRLKAAIEVGQDLLPCQMVKGCTPIELARLLYMVHNDKIQLSVISRICFLKYLSTIGVDADSLIELFLPLLQFEGHERIWRRIEKVHGLSQEILEFCHQKKYSLKQCVHLTRHPKELLYALFSLRGELFYTAALLDELCSDLGDYLKLHDMSMELFLADEEVRGCLSAAHLQPPQKTKRFRELIKHRRYPLLSGARQRMEMVRSEMKLPQNIVVTWDPILESDQIDLSIKIRDQKDLRLAVEKLGTREVADGICLLAKEL